MEKNIELPEIQEFLKLARTYKRQLKILKKSNLNLEHKALVDKVVNIIEKTNEKYRN